MLSPYSKLKLRRRVRSASKQVERLHENTSQHFNEHIAKRWKNLKDVRRFVIAWLSLVLILMSSVAFQSIALEEFYLSEAPAPGGVFVEGTIGEVNNLNPLFATTGPETTVSRLIFGGLLKYDDNAQLAPDLAEKWDVSGDGLIYTMVLRRNVVWHDGTPFTSRDVVYTFQAVQHPDTRSPLNSSWRDIKVQSKDDYTVTFTLPNPFTPFPHSLTTGIIPAHAFKDVEPLGLRAHEFNVSPTVGTGPFKFEKLVVQGGLRQVELVKNERHYVQPPQLERFIVRAFRDHEEMIAVFKRNELTSMAGLRAHDYDNVKGLKGAVYYDVPLYNAVFAFLNNDDEILKDAKVRQALVYGTNQDRISEVLKRRYAVLHGPLLDGQLDYARDFWQVDFDIDRARALLSEAGWIPAEPDGIRRKGDMRLEIRIHTQNTDEYPAVTAELQRQWREVGVDLKAELLPSDNLQQNHVIPHNYQILLYGISMGADPDVFVYWHAVQAIAGGFNFSNYRSAAVNAALESGRTRNDTELRRAKYNSFLSEWKKDAPAVALYQSGFGYVQKQKVRGFVARPIVDPAGRLGNVINWTVNTQKVPKQ